MLGFGGDACSQVYLQGVWILDGLGEGCGGERGTEAAKPLPPAPLPSSGLWNPSLLLPHRWPCSQHVCYSVSTMIYCYLPFYSPPLPMVFFSFFLFYWLGRK